ncbi:MAG: hypothetical protein UGF89_02510 [Acutalibacteraceae bacterium]|nr:hypothetical protein [Acutalibacteraceae bacterium]
MAGDKPLIPNPFTNAELEDCFNKQLNKIPFELTKEVKTEGPKPIVLRLSYLETDNKGVWNDTYIVDFSYDNRNTTYGCGYARNRFDNFETFKNEIFEAFGLEEETQLSLF